MYDSSRAFDGFFLSYLVPVVIHSSMVEVEDSFNVRENTGVYVWKRVVHNAILIYILLLFLLKV